MKLTHNTLQVHGLTITFQRTLRIPDDGRDWPLPPGLGCFPLRRVDDYPNTAPKEWLEHGGVFLPMFQREAMWMSLSGSPHAVKVGVGRRCAVTGKKWRDALRTGRQDYLVAPPQPWLDGICVSEGRIRQFVAMPLGSAVTVEGQLTDKEEHGGLQIAVMPPKPGAIPPRPARRMRCAPPAPCAAAPRAASMGLAAGGSMRQKIYKDPHGVGIWDQDRRQRVWVHLCNSALWTAITGEAAPTSPVTVERYRMAGLPWFDVYDDHLSALPGEHPARPGEEPGRGHPRRGLVRDQPLRVRLPDARLRTRRRGRPRCLSGGGAPLHRPGAAA